MLQNAFHTRLAGQRLRKTNLWASCLLARLALGASACGQVDVGEDVAAADALLSAPSSDIEIRITSPAHGDFWSEGSSVEVAGQASGLSGLGAGIEVNGVAAAITHHGDTATWVADVPVVQGEIFKNLVAELTVPAVDVKAVDLVTVIVGDSAGETQPARAALGFRVTSTALDKVEPMVASIIEEKVSTYIPTGKVQMVDPDKPWYMQVQQLYADHFLDITIVDASPSEFSVELKPREGAITAEATLSDLFLNVEVLIADGAFDTPGVDLVGLYCDLDVSVEAVTVGVDFDLVPNDASLVALKQDGKPRPKVVDLVWDFSSGACAIPGVENIMDEFMPDLEVMLKKAVAGAQLEMGEANSKMAEALETVLNRLALVSPATFDVAVSGEPHEDATGLTFAASTTFEPNFGVAGCEPNALDPVASLVVPSALPSLDDVTPNITLPYDVALMIAPTAWNQFLRTQAECGMPERNLGKVDFGSGPEDIEAGDLDDYLPSFKDVHPSKMLAMRLKPTLAPVVTGAPGPGGELLDLLIAGYVIEIYDPYAADETVYLAAALSGRFGVDLAVVAGALRASVNLPGHDELGVEVYGGIVDANAESFASLVPSIIGPVLDDIERRLGGFPLPTPAGMSFTPVEVARVDDVPTFYLDLAPAMCGAGYDASSDGTCYEQCADGYDGRDDECMKDCPAEFTDYGDSCHHDLEIVAKKSESRGVGSIPTCGSSLEKQGELCYPKCRSGFKGVGPVCWERCPSGYKDDGATCRKDAIIKSKHSYSRGAGKPMTCASSEELRGGLCYKKCKSGYKGVGTRCYKNCSSGYKDDGLTCRRNARSIKKSTSGCPWYNLCCKGCPSGYRNDGCFCTRDARIVGKSSYSRGVGKPVRYCPKGTQKSGALCYPACKSGYKAVGSRCWKNCPSGYKDDGATCRKDAIIKAKRTEGRGAGTLPAYCSSSRRLEDGLCYRRCNNGWDGVGPICYEPCASKYTDDGLFCRIDDTTFRKDSYPRHGFKP